MREQRRSVERQRRYGGVTQPGRGAAKIARVVRDQQDRDDGDIGSQRTRQWMPEVYAEVP